MNPYKAFIELNRNNITDFIFLQNQDKTNPSLYIVAEQADIDNINFDVLFENGGSFATHMPRIIQQSEMDVLRRYLRE